MDNDKPAWTTKSLARAANVSAAYIRQVLIARDLPGQKLGRDWLIPYEEGRRWLEERAKKKAPPNE